MNGLETLLEWSLEIGTVGLAWSLTAAWYAGLLAAVALAVDVVSRRWLTAAQKNVLWGLVLLRLLMPAAPPSWLSLQNISLSAIAPSEVEVNGWLPSTEGGDPPADSVETWMSAPRHAESEPTTEFPWAELVFFISLPLVWLGGFAGVLGWTAIVHWRFSRRIGRFPACGDERLAGLWQSCRDEVGRARTIPIVCTGAVSQAAVMGLLRPRLLLPLDAAAFDDGQLRMIMLHELAHVRRWDVASNWALVLLRAAHWWNPVYWLAASRFVDLREQACDDWVVRRLQPDAKRGYGELLLAMAARDPAQAGWRVTLPAGILGFLSSYFRQRAIRQRLQGLKFAGVRPGRTRTAMAAIAIALVAIAGLTDARPPAAVEEFANWTPPISLDSPAPATEAGPLVTQRYDLTGVLARVEADGSQTPNAAASLRWLIEVILQINRPANGQDGAALKVSPASYTLDGANLTAQAPAVLQQRLAESIGAWEQSGIGQIAVSCRFLSTDHDLVPAAGAWQLMESRPPDFRPVGEIESSAAAPIARAGASVSEEVPVSIAILSKAQAEALIAGFYWKSPGQALEYFNVTLCNGTRAKIGGCTQTPFVVGVRRSHPPAREAIIRILEEGTTIALRGVHSNDRRQTRLCGYLEISKIGEVRERPALFDPEATVQLPSGKRWRIDFDSTVKEGESVLIGFVPTENQKLIAYALLTVNTVEPLAEVAAK